MHDMNEMFDRLGVPPEKQAAIQEKLNEKLSYKPKIGILGKNGVGKSSLCNALFGQNLCEISDVESCTKEPQEVLLNIGSQGITLLDFPGVGESQEDDEKNGKLYVSLLSELDLVLWVLKADDRTFSSDELFYKSIVKPHIDEGKPFFFVLNQVDKIDPFREWNVAEHRPGKTQLENIDKMIDAVSRSFDCPKGWVVPVSANEKYNLDGLVDTFIFALPREQKFTVGCDVKPENVSNIFTLLREQNSIVGGDVKSEIISNIFALLREQNSIVGGDVKSEIISNIFALLREQNPIVGRDVKLENVSMPEDLYKAAKDI